MNVRGNICVQERFGGRVYLYAHTRGLETFNILRSAIVRGLERLHDEQYFTRILFCEMLSGTDLNATSDYGISTFVGENDLPIFVVDVANLRVLMEDGRCMATCPCIGYAWTFEDFMKLEQDPRIEWLQKTYPAETKEVKKKGK